MRRRSAGHRRRHRAADDAVGPIDREIDAGLVVGRGRARSPRRSSSAADVRDRARSGDTSPPTDRQLDTCRQRSSALHAARHHAVDNHRALVPVPAPPSRSAATTGLPLPSTTLPAIDRAGLHREHDLGPSPADIVDGLAALIATRAARREHIGSGLRGGQLNSPSGPVVTGVTSIGISRGPRTCRHVGRDLADLPRLDVARELHAAAHAHLHAVDVLVGELDRAVEPARRSRSVPISCSDPGGSPSSTNAPLASVVALPSPPNATTSTSAAGAPLSSTTMPRRPAPAPTTISTSLICSATPRPDDRRASARAPRLRAQLVRAGAQAGDAGTARRLPRSRGAATPRRSDIRGRRRAARRRCAGHRLVRVLVAHDALDRRHRARARSRRSRRPRRRRRSATAARSRALAATSTWPSATVSLYVPSAPVSVVAIASSGRPSDRQASLASMRAPATGRPLASVTVPAACVRRCEHEVDLGRRP